jgi:ArsR family transcriptional regulator
MFLKLLPPVVVADLGAGEGAIALLLAQRARKVIAVDNSQKMRDYATDLAKKHGVDNLDYRVGDLEELPVADAEADLAIFHQSLHHALHPAQAMGEAARILRPGGRVAVLDLLKHGFEEARDLYSDVWLGFSQVELTGLLEDAGLLGIAVSVVDRESEAPHFETVLAVGEKPAGTSPQRAE